MWGNFPSRSHDVPLITPSAEIGTVPAFNLMRFNTGDVIDFAGQHWQIGQLNSNQIKVERTSRRKTVEISYSGSRPGPRRSYSRRDVAPNTRWDNRG